MNKLLTTILALAVSSVSLVAQAQDVAGKADVGAKNAAMCVGCHGIVGYQASFPMIHKVPKIAGQTEGYIRSALIAYRGGERKHPTMKAIAASLSDEDIANLAAYYSQLGKDDAVVPEAPASAPDQKVQALITRGVCVTCHGANFNKPNAANVPKLAGQHADYLKVALRSYQEQHMYWGRTNAIMGGIVAAAEKGKSPRFSPAELGEVASYIASLPGDLKTVPDSKIHRPH